MWPFVQQHKKSFGAVAVLVVAAGLVYLINTQKITPPTTLKNLETVTNDFLVQTLHSNIFAPAPLKDTQTVERGTLSVAGVFQWTNDARTKEGVKALLPSTALNAIAQKKLQDMFFYQYFDHVSPLGIGPGDLAKKNGYDYIVIGENLAMGNFVNDQALLQAWLNSPGHRANILNTRYTEIGIAVAQGIYEGKSTWIAVQEFGLPISVCPQPLAQDKVAIDSQKKAIDTQEALLTTQRAEIDATEKKSGVDYEAKVNAYNELVRQYNATVVALKAKIAAYNQEVAVFNTCAQGSATSTTVTES